MASSRMSARTSTVRPLPAGTSRYACSIALAITSLTPRTRAERSRAPSPTPAPHRVDVATDLAELLGVGGDVQVEGERRAAAVGREDRDVVRETAVA